jgi:hypothetical protein
VAKQYLALEQTPLLGTRNIAYIVTSNISFDTAAKGVGHDDPNPLLRVVDEFPEW